MYFWQRKMMPVIIVAYLSYLFMSGIDDVHHHSNSFGIQKKYQLSEFSQYQAEENCQICLWHAMVSVSHAFTIMLLPVYFAKTKYFFQTEFYIPVTIINLRSRAPPIMIFCQ
jgi:hypothetical protein